MRSNKMKKEESKKLNFGDAIKALKSGSKVIREGWNGKCMWLKLVESENYAVTLLLDDLSKSGIDKSPWIGMKTADNKFVPWLASQTDVLAEDWMVIIE